MSLGAHGVGPPRKNDHLPITKCESMLGLIPILGNRTDFLDPWPQGIEQFFSLFSRNLERRVFDQFQICKLQLHRRPRMQLQTDLTGEGPLRIVNGDRNDPVDGGPDPMSHG